MEEDLNELHDQVDLTNITLTHTVQRLDDLANEQTRTEEFDKRIKIKKRNRRQTSSGENISGVSLPSFQTNQAESNSQNNSELLSAPGVRMQMSKLVGGEYQMRVKVPHRLAPIVSKTFKVVRILHSGVGCDMVTAAQSSLTTGPLGAQGIPWTDEVEYGVWAQQMWQLEDAMKTFTEELDKNFTEAVRKSKARGVVNTSRAMDGLADDHVNDNKKEIRDDEEEHEEGINDDDDDEEYDDNDDEDDDDDNDEDDDDDDDEDDDDDGDNDDDGHEENEERSDNDGHADKAVLSDEEQARQKAWRRRMLQRRELWQHPASLTVKRGEDATKPRSYGNKGIVPFGPDQRQTNVEERMLSQDQKKQEMKRRIESRKKVSVVLPSGRALKHGERVGKRMRKQAIVNTIAVEDDDQVETDKISIEDGMKAQEETHLFHDNGDVENEVYEWRDAGRGGWALPREVNERIEHGMEVDAPTATSYNPDVAQKSEIRKVPGAASFGQVNKVNVNMVAAVLLSCPNEKHSISPSEVEDGSDMNNNKDIINEEFDLISNQSSRVQITEISLHDSFLRLDLRDADTLRVIQTASRKSSRPAKKCTRNKFSQRAITGGFAESAPMTTAENATSDQKGALSSKPPLPSGFIYNMAEWYEKAKLNGSLEVGSQSSLALGVSFVWPVMVTVIGSKSVLTNSLRCEVSLHENLGDVLIRTINLRKQSFNKLDIDNYKCLILNSFSEFKYKTNALKMKMKKKYKEKSPLKEERRLVQDEYDVGIEYTSSDSVSLSLKNGKYLIFYFDQEEDNDKISSPSERTEGQATWTIDLSRFNNGKNTPISRSYILGSERDDVNVKTNRSNLLKIAILLEIEIDFIISSQNKTKQFNDKSCQSYQDMNTRKMRTKQQEESISKGGISHLNERRRAKYHDGLQPCPTCYQRCWWECPCLCHEVPNSGTWQTHSHSAQQENNGGVVPNYEEEAKWFKLTQMFKFDLMSAVKQKIAQQMDDHFIDTDSDVDSEKHVRNNQSSEWYPEWAAPEPFIMDAESFKAEEQQLKKSKLKTMLQASSTLNSGDRVEARLAGGPAWLLGTVTRRYDGAVEHDDDKTYFTKQLSSGSLSSVYYEIRFDVGAIEQCPAENVRRLLMVPTQLEIPTMTSATNKNKSVEGHNDDLSTNDKIAIKYRDTQWQEEVSTANLSSCLSSMENESNGNSMDHPGYECKLNKVWKPVKVLSWHINGLVDVRTNEENKKYFGIPRNQLRIINRQQQQQQPSTSFNSSLYHRNDVVDCFENNVDDVDDLKTVYDKRKENELKEDIKVRKVLTQLLTRHHLARQFHVHIKYTKRASIYPDSQGKKYQPARRLALIIGQSGGRTIEKDKRIQQILSEFVSIAPPPSSSSSLSSSSASSSSIQGSVNGEGSTKNVIVQSDGSVQLPYYFNLSIKSSHSAEQDDPSTITRVIGGAFLKAARPLHALIDVNSNKSNDDDAMDENDVKEELVQDTNLPAYMQPLVRDSKYLESSLIGNEKNKIRKTNDHDATSSVFKSKVERGLPFETKQQPETLSKNELKDKMVSTQQLHFGENKDPLNLLSTKLGPSAVPRLAAPNITKPRARLPSSKHIKINYNNKNLPNQRENENTMMVNHNDVDGSVKDDMSNEIFHQNENCSSNKEEEEKGGSGVNSFIGKNIVGGKWHPLPEKHQSEQKMLVMAKIKSQGKGGPGEYDTTKGIDFIKKRTRGAMVTGRPKSVFEVQSNDIDHNELEHMKSKGDEKKSILSNEKMQNRTNDQHTENSESKMMDEERDEESKYDGSDTSTSSEESYTSSFSSYSSDYSSWSDEGLSDSDQFESSYINSSHKKEKKTYEYKEENDKFGEIKLETNQVVQDERRNRSKKHRCYEIKRLQKERRKAIRKEDKRILKWEIKQERKQKRKIEKLENKSKSRQIKNNKTENDHSKKLKKKKNTKSIGTMDKFHPLDAPMFRSHVPSTSFGGVKKEGEGSGVGWKNRAAFRRMKEQQQLEGMGGVEGPGHYETSKAIEHTTEIKSTTVGPSFSMGIESRRKTYLHKMFKSQNIEDYVIEEDIKHLKNKTNNNNETKLGEFEEEEEEEGKWNDNYEDQFKKDDENSKSLNTKKKAKRRGRKPVPEKPAYFSSLLEDRATWIPQGAAGVAGSEIQYGPQLQHLWVEPSEEEKEWKKKLENKNNKNFQSKTRDNNEHNDESIQIGNEIMNDDENDGDQDNDGNECQKELYNEYDEDEIWALKTAGMIQTTTSADLPVNKDIDVKNISNNGPHMPLKSPNSPSSRIKQGENTIAAYAEAQRRRGSKSIQKWNLKPHNTSIDDTVDEYVDERALLRASRIAQQKKNNEISLEYLPTQLHSSWVPEKHFKKNTIHQDKDDKQPTNNKVFDAAPSGAVHSKVGPGAVLGIPSMSLQKGRESVEILTKGVRKVVPFSESGPQSVVPLGPGHHTDGVNKAFDYLRAERGGFQLESENAMGRITNRNDHIGPFGEKPNNDDDYGNLEVVREGDVLDLSPKMRPNIRQSASYSFPIQARGLDNNEEDDENLPREGDRLLLSPDHANRMGERAVQGQKYMRFENQISPSRNKASSVMGGEGGKGGDVEFDELLLRRKMLEEVLYEDEEDDDDEDEDDIYSPFGKKEKNMKSKLLKYKDLKSIIKKDGDNLILSPKYSDIVTAGKGGVFSAAERFEVGDQLNQDHRLELSPRKADALVYRNNKGGVVDYEKALGRPTNNNEEANKLLFYEEEEDDDDDDERKSTKNKSEFFYDSDDYEQIYEKLKAVQSNRDNKYKQAQSFAIKNDIISSKNIEIAQKNLQYNGMKGVVDFEKDKVSRILKTENDLDFIEYNSHDTEDDEEVQKKREKKKSKNTMNRVKFGDILSLSPKWQVTKERYGKGGVLDMGQTSELQGRGEDALIAGLLKVNIGDGGDGLIQLNEKLNNSIDLSPKEDEEEEEGRLDLLDNNNLINIKQVTKMSSQWQKQEGDRLQLEPEQVSKKRIPSVFNWSIVADRWDDQEIFKKNEQKINDDELQNSPEISRGPFVNDIGNKTSVNYDLMIGREDIEKLDLMKAEKATRLRGGLLPASLASSFESSTSKATNPSSTNSPLSSPWLSSNHNQVSSSLAVCTATQLPLSSSDPLSSLNLKVKTKKIKKLTSKTVWGMPRETAEMSKQWKDAVGVSSTVNQVATGDHGRGIHETIALEEKERGSVMDLLGPEEQIEKDHDVECNRHALLLNPRHSSVEPNQRGTHF